MSLPGLLAGQLDHVVGEVDDPDRVTHLEHEDLAALGERAGADDQLHGLRDRHEVARHPLVGHGHRPAGAIWRRKIGTTDPDEPSTLPNRTVE